MIGIKQIFTWWNKKTLGTFFKTLFFGKYVGSDSYGNKYYKNKSDERWVIYSKDIEATKITSDWFLWMHHTTNEIPNDKSKKYEWEKIIRIIYQVLPKHINQIRYQKNKFKAYETWKN